MYYSMISDNVTISTCVYAGSSHFTYSHFAHSHLPTNKINRLRFCACCLSIMLSNSSIISHHSTFRLQFGSGRNHLIQDEIVLAETT